MRLRSITILASVILCLAPTSSWADLAPYSQDFEGLVPAPQELPATSLGDDGWLVFGNVFGPDWGYWYGYGTFSAPNNGEAFSAVVAGEGGPVQGTQQLNVFSDYNNTNHGDGAFIEANVFHEQTVGAADVGTTWLFEYDAKRGNIEGATTAKAFFKTLDPAAGYALTNFIWIDMTDIPITWESYELSIFIDSSLQGQLLQFGFLSTATAYQGSGIYYDNVVFRRQPLGVGFDVKPGSCPNPINTRANGWLPTAVLGTADLDVGNLDIDSLRLEGVAPVAWGYEDVSQPYTGDLPGCTRGGPDGFLDLTLKFANQDLIEAIGSTELGDRTLTLTGTLLDGTPIEGQDYVFIRGGYPVVHIGTGNSGSNLFLPLSIDDSGTWMLPRSTREGNVRTQTSPRSRTD